MSYDWSRVLPADGWCTPEKAERIYRTVFELAEQDLHLVGVEIGVWGGRSLIPAAMALRDVDAGFVFGFDPYSSHKALEAVTEAEHREWWGKVDYEAIYQGTLAALNRLNLLDWCSLVRTPAERAAHAFQGLRYLHIDGNHSTEASVRDVTLWLPRVASGGVIVLDDAAWTSVRKARDLIVATCDELYADGQYEVYRKR
jgi:hypothetical protein